METLYIVIPAYNEEKTISAVIDDWYEVVKKHNGGGKSRLVVIDDGGEDHTYEIAKNKKEKMPLLEVIKKKNSGHAPTCMYGYRYALKNGADMVFQTDSDGQTLASEFEPFWDALKENDVIMGFREKRGDGFGRLVVSRGLSIVNFLIFHVKVKDANVPYRLMKAEALEKTLALVPKDFVLGNAVLSVAFEKNGYHIKYLPISFVVRGGGVSMYNLKKIVGLGMKTLSSFVKINKHMTQKIKGGKKKA